MPYVATEDGVEIFYKDWGTGQPIVFSHGWPLSATETGGWDRAALECPLGVPGRVRSISR